MTRLSARVSQLECAAGGDGRRPVLLLGPADDELAALAKWQALYGPCDAEPLFVRLVGL